MAQSTIAVTGAALVCACGKFRLTFATPPNSDDERAVITAKVTAHRARYPRRAHQLTLQIAADIGEPEAGTPQ